MHERNEIIRIGITWLTPLIVLGCWMFRINREKAKFGSSILVKKWYSNIWFVILMICLWAVVIDIIVARINGHGR
jgi:uncharacterized membrane protein